jgi:hypothetical protein
MKTKHFYPNKKISTVKPTTLVVGGLWLRQIFLLILSHQISHPQIPSTRENNFALSIFKQLQYSTT